MSDYRALRRVLCWYEEQELWCVVRADACGVSGMPRVVQDEWVYLSRDWGVSGTSVPLRMVESVGPYDGVPADAPRWRRDALNNEEEARVSDKTSRWAGHSDQELQDLHDALCAEIVGEDDETTVARYARLVCELRDVATERAPGYQGPGLYRHACGKTYWALGKGHLAGQTVVVLNNHEKDEHLYLESMTDFNGRAADGGPRYRRVSENEAPS